MNSTLLTKIKIFSILVTSFILMIAFQNCGKINLLNAKNIPGAGTAVAKGEANPPDPNPVIDPPHDGLGGSLPTVGGGDGGGESSGGGAGAGQSGIPTCYYLDVDSASGLYVATFQSANTRLPVYVNSVKVLLPGDVLVDASSYDEAHASAYINLSQGQFNAGIAGALVAGPGYSVSISQCVPESLPPVSTSL